MNVTARIKEQANLARVYVEDGALHSATRVLRELADEVEQQAILADKFLEQMIAQGKVEQAPAKAGE